MRVFIPNLKSWYACARGPQVDHPQKARVGDSQLTRDREVTRAPSVTVHRAAPAGQRPRARETCKPKMRCVVMKVPFWIVVGGWGVIMVWQEAAFPMSCYIVRKKLAPGACHSHAGGSILEQCVHRFPRWRRANRQSILLIRRDWSYRRRCLPDGDKNKDLSLSSLFNSCLLSSTPFSCLALSCLLPVSLPLHVSSFLI